MTLISRFHTPPFEYMANRNNAHIRFTPPAVERHVGVYLETLANACKSTTFDPNGSVNALIFGEWGHGKSHVLYRTERHLQAAPGVLVLTLVPELLNPKRVLQTAITSLRARDSGLDLKSLEDAWAKVSTLSDEDRASERIVARAFALFAKNLDRRHVVLLFDEVQTTTDSFQGFVTALEKEFRDAQIVLHLLQCHSLATLDYALKVAASLGPWLQRARQIHLPAIQLRDAHKFFADRLAECTTDKALAAKLVPDGVARTICEAAGGNPRKMLQYAGQLLRSCDEHHEEQFSGRGVVDVFSREAGMGAGKRLYSEQELRRIVELLPQEIGPFGVRIASLLEKRIDRLFGEWEAITALEISRELGDVAAHQLDGLLRPVDGLPLFQTREDDFGSHEYLLSDAFRRRLSAGFGYTGSVDLKQNQVDLLFRPTELQANIADGLRTILFRERVATANPRPVPLGEFPPPAPAYSPIPIRGYRTTVPIARTSFAVPVLVTGICSLRPPLLMIERIVEGLVSGEWLFAYIFYSNENLPWANWEEEEEAKNALAPLKNTQSKIIAIEDNDWGELVHVSDERHRTQPSVVAAQFFADIVGATRLIDSPSEEAEQFAVRLADLVRTRLPTLSTVCYLPSDDERALLDNNDLWGDRRSTKEVSLKEMKEKTGRSWSGRDLNNLLDSYLEKRKGNYVRRPDDTCLIYNALRDVLEERPKQSLSVDDLRKEMERRVVTAGSGDPRDVVEWLLRKLVDGGVAVVDLTQSYRYRDVRKESRERDQSIAASLKELRRRIADVQKYKISLAEPLAAELTTCERKKPKHDVPQNERLDLLIALGQDLLTLSNKVSAAEARVKEETQNVIDLLEELLTKVRSRRSALPLRWQPLILSDAQLDALQLALSHIAAPEGADGEELYELVTRRREALESTLTLALTRVEGRVQANGDSLQELKNLIASGAPFQAVTLTVEIE
jgi:hypothetical protein